MQTAVSGGLGMGASLRSKVDDKGKISAWLTLTTKSLNEKYDAIELLKLAFENCALMKKIALLSCYNSVQRAGNHVCRALAIAMQCKWHHVMPVH